MSPSQRITALKKFNTFVFPDVPPEPQKQCCKKRSSEEEPLSRILLTNMPTSIANEVVEEAKEIEKGNSIIKCFGGTYFVKNENELNNPFKVVVNFKRPDISCKSDKCLRYTTFGICSHVLSVAARVNLVNEIVRNCNKKKIKVSQLADWDKEKDAGKKKVNATQRRKGQANKKFLPLQNLVVQDATIKAPKKPDPGTNGYMLYLLKFCHPKVYSCYGCGGKFFEQGISDEPNDLVSYQKLDERTLIQQSNSKYNRQR